MISDHRVTGVIIKPEPELPVTAAAVSTARPGRSPAQGGCGPAPGRGDRFRLSGRGSESQAACAPGGPEVTWCLASRAAAVEIGRPERRGGHKFKLSSQSGLSGPGLGDPDSPPSRPAGLGPPAHRAAVACDWPGPRPGPLPG
jgi:hypothetical protein